MKIQGPFSQNVPQSDDLQIKQNEANVEQSDSLEKFDSVRNKEADLEFIGSAATKQTVQDSSNITTAEQKQQQLEAAKQEQLAAASSEEEGGFEWYDVLPFGIGNWLDDEGTVATDIGRTILQVICPIPFVGGLLADFGGDWLGNALADAAEWTGTAIGDAAEWIGGAVEDAAEAVGDAAGDVIDAVGDAAGDVVDAIGDAAGDVADAIGDVFSW